MRCRQHLSDVVAALLVGAVLLAVVWAVKHTGGKLDAGVMLGVDAAAGAAYLVLQRVLARR